MQSNDWVELGERVVGGADVIRSDSIACMRWSASRYYYLFISFSRLKLCMPVHGVVLSCHMKLKLHNHFTTHSCITNIWSADRQRHRYYYCPTGFAISSTIVPLRLLHSSFGVANFALVSHGRPWFLEWMGYAIWERRGGKIFGIDQMDSRTD